MGCNVGGVRNVGGGVGVGCGMTGVGRNVGVGRNDGGVGGGAVCSATQFYGMRSLAPPRFWSLK